MHFSAANFFETARVDFHNLPKNASAGSSGVCQSSVPGGVGWREHNLDNSGPLRVECAGRQRSSLSPPYAFLGEGRFFWCRHELTPQISRNQNLKIQGWIRLMDARRDCRCQLSLAHTSHSHHKPFGDAPDRAQVVKDLTEIAPIV